MTKAERERLRANLTDDILVFGNYVKPNLLTQDVGLALLDLADSLEAECAEQARLNGMGSEREARLMARVAEVEKERDEALARLSELELHNTEHFCGVGEIAKERDDLRARFAQAEKDVARLEDKLVATRALYEKKGEESARLREALDQLRAVAAAARRVLRETEHGPLLTDGAIVQVRDALAALDAKGDGK